MAENDTPGKPSRLAAAISRARGDVNSDNIEAGINFLNQQSEGIRKQSPEDVQRIGTNLEELLNEPMPTAEEADAYLRGLGVIKKCEVCGQDATLTNDFVSHLMERYQSVYAELQRLRANLAAPDAAQWSSEFPIVHEGHDAYYFVRRRDALDVVVAGFSMGKMWLNGIMYEPQEINNHLFLGPLTPEMFLDDAVRQARRETCVWALDDLMDGDLWETSCGQAFQFNDGGPEDNHFKFCYCCGRPLEALRRTEGDEVDEVAALGAEGEKGNT